MLNTNNYWTSIHYEPVSFIEDDYLNIFDLVGPGSYSYTVTYTNVPVNTNPPVTTLVFAGSSTFTNGIYYVTPGHPDVFHFPGRPARSALSTA